MPPRANTTQSSITPECLFSRIECGGIAKHWFYFSSSYMKFQPSFRIISLSFRAGHTYTELLYLLKSLQNIPFSEFALTRHEIKVIKLLELLVVTWVLPEVYWGPRIKSLFFGLETLWSLEIKRLGESILLSFN